jgi:hypothetical protein
VELGEAVALGRVEALFSARTEFDVLLRAAVVAACSAGVPRLLLADLLGVHRSTLYRQWLTEDGSGHGCD